MSRAVGGCGAAHVVRAAVRALVEVAVCALVMDVGFYYSHRLLHHPRLYAAIHKFHHSLTTPVAIGAECARPHWTYAFLYGSPIGQMLSRVRAGMRTRSSSSCPTSRP